jgi:L-ascorbate metabolism protein UlaG (beta-lactamase superfamily)
MKTARFVYGLTVGCLILAPPLLARARAQALVKVTPLGSHDGELCSGDRALLFEDPTGVRILYDPGRTVDETDPRVGDVHVMLLTHAHPDHIGDVRPGRGGTCDAPVLGAANPNSNFATIAAAKRAASFLVSSEMDTFIARKVQDVTGSATPLCVARNRDDETVVPVATACVARLHPGGSLVVRRAGAGQGVRLAAVQAMHPNGIPAQLLDAPGSSPGTGAYGGIAGGYVVQFTNGLVAYLTGDTGIFADMEIIGKFYRPNLLVINIGDVGTLGPREAAYVVQNLVRGTSIMPSHTYEQSTVSGVPRTGSRLEYFMSLVRGLADIVVPIASITRTFDGDGRCVGCR